MFRKTLLIVIIGAILFTITSYVFFKEKEAPPEKIVQQYNTLIHVNERPLLVEIADRPDSQMQGLSIRESLGEDEGMLFIFSNPLMPAFWMKEMKFSLDIIWIDERGVIIAINKNISPDTFPQTFLPPSDIKYVVETNAGWSDKNNIEVGGKLVMQ